MFLRAPALIAALFLVSCGSARLPMPNIAPYRMEIQQGNFVSQEMVSQLKLGMSKDQVRFVLGTALIADSFHADRWDYVFRRQKVNSTELEHRSFTVFFKDGKLARIEGDVTAGTGAEVAAVKTPSPKPEAPAPKPETPAPKPETPAPKAEAPAPKAEAPALMPEAPVAMPQALKQPSSGAAPEFKPAAQTAAEVAKPEAENSAAAPVPSGDGQPQGKSWWERLKDKVGF